MLTYLIKNFPAMDSKMIFAVLATHSMLAMLCIVVMMLFQSGRKRLRKYWRLSQQGPFYRLGAYICRKIFGAFVEVTRPMLGDRVVTDPKKLTPRFTTIKTQSDRIILNWTVANPNKSAWAKDEYELQVCSVSPPAGDGPAEVKEWETLQRSGEQAYDYKNLEAGKNYSFRVRTVNAKGESDWTAGEFGTRQVPVDNGGSGPGYTWKQTSKEVQALVACRSDAKPKDMSVTCAAGRLRVEDARGPAVLVDGALWGAVKAADISWALTDSAGGKRLVITLEKAKETTARKEHWQALLQGNHPLIDRRFLPDATIAGKLESM